mmetsp:Transcript_36614/g.102302  ORF Transcript_36614/g.102302 Transcript_36614/m.102302 type:complete len:215 (+) Transcript_36614:1381-2025(+)
MVTCRRRRRPRPCAAAKASRQAQLSSCLVLPPRAVLARASDGATAPQALLRPAPRDPRPGGHPDRVLSAPPRTTAPLRRYLDPGRLRRAVSPQIRGNQRLRRGRLLRCRRRRRWRQVGQQQTQGPWAPCLPATRRQPQSSSAQCRTRKSVASSRSHHQSWPAHHHHRLRLPPRRCRAGWCHRCPPSHPLPRTREIAIRCGAGHRVPGCARTVRR